jgi:hypothetical protein
MGPRRLFAPSGEALRLGHASSSEPAGNRGKSTTIGFVDEGPPTKEVELAQGPKDEDDPTQLRRFAKRIAEMKWWNNSNSDEPAGTQDRGEQSGSEGPQAPSEDQQPREPRAGEEEQPTTGDGPSSDGETSKTNETK